MTISEFLGYCARSIEAGIPVQGSLAPKGWGAYVGLTLPQGSDHASPEEVVSTRVLRVLRFLLAQAIAKSEEDETHNGTTVFTQHGVWVMGRGGEIEKFDFLTGAWTPA